MDIGKLEAVQRRMTTMIQGMRSLTYKDRLKHFNLHYLAIRRVKGELIEVGQGFQQRDIIKVLIIKEKVKTRTNGFKHDKFRYRKARGKNMFTNRVVIVVVVVVAVVVVVVVAVVVVAIVIVVVVVVVVAWTTRPL